MLCGTQVDKVWGETSTVEGKRDSEGAKMATKGEAGAPGFLSSGAAVPVKSDVASVHS